MDNLYDDQYKNETIKVILDQLEDLSEWSNHNEDEYLELIEAIKTAIRGMEK